MKIFTDVEGNIRDVGSTSKLGLTEYDLIDDELNPFMGWENARIKCFRVTVDNGRVMMFTPSVWSNMIDTIVDTETSLDNFSAISAIVFVLLAEKSEIDDTTCMEHADVFLPWDEYSHYKIGNIRRYEDNLYRCLTEHDSQASWTPDVSPSLWVKIGDPTEEYPAWSQPLASADAYMTGDKVSHLDKHWHSTVGNNVWEPGVYGWEEDE